MRCVLVDPGTRDCRNMGDVAMLQVAIARIGTLLPGARICVLTDDPAELQRQCPTVVAVPHLGRDLWIHHRHVWGWLWRVMPARIRGWAGRGQRLLRRAQPRLYRRMLLGRFSSVDGAPGAIDSFARILAESDALVFCGQGALADSAMGDALCLLATAESGHEAGVPVFLFGQGVGPMSDPFLLERARAVLPVTRVIASRGGRSGPPLLRSIGVPESALLTTGDDAIELAYAARPETMGKALGLHVRLAPLAVADPGLLEPIRGAVHYFALKQSVPVVPLPISHHAIGSHDATTIQRVLAGFDDTSEGGRNLVTPAQVIAAAGRCRVILTCAYHAAVFGLSQGIPVVCLWSSAYYLEKFQGLEEHFGTGVRLVPMAGDGFEARIVAALDSAWQSADETRQPLLAAAARQVALGQEAYSRLTA